MLPPSFRKSALVPMLALGAFACAEAPVGPESMSLQSVTALTSESVDPSIWDRSVFVCKVGTNATFSVSVNGGTATSASVADGACELVHTQPAGVDVNNDVAVTENASSTYSLDSIVVEATRYGLVQSRTVLTGTATANVLATWTKGGIVTFYNTPILPPPPPPPPAGGQGCTPGYWKQSQHFDSWVGYTPNTLFSDVFENAFPGRTLLQVLELGGGGLNALGRHTVAALLNTANNGVAYDIGSSADVISAFNAAFPGGDYETLKNRFAGFNEQGCPLN